MTTFDTGKIKDYLHDTFHVTDSALLDEILEFTSYKSFKKGEILYPKGTYLTYFCILCDGILRGFDCLYGEEETTTCFIDTNHTGLFIPAVNIVPDGHWIVCESVQAMTDVSTICIPFDFGKSVLLTNPDISFKMLCTAIQSFTVGHNRFEKMIRLCNAKEKYQWFLREYPTIDQCVADKYIASFLGMDVATLCRQRRQCLRNHIS